jgi:AcrR family transcriptional regulator
MPPPDETTKSRLLDAAEDLFAERGYEAVGIREIADRAGVNLSGIKYHFGSKRGLYLSTIERSVNERGAGEAWALLAGPFGSREDAAAALSAFIRAFLRVLLGPEEEASGACLVMQSAMEGGDACDLVVREFIRPHHERLCGVIGVLCPEAGEHRRSRCAQSIMAQILHQRMFREFLRRIDPDLGSDPGAIAGLADEIAEFSLRGMGCDDLVGIAIGAAGAEALGEKA